MMRTLGSLSADETAAIEALIARSEAFDAAYSCVQFDHGLNFRKNIPGWFLAQENGRIDGVASVFAPMEGEAEISVCVAPEARGRGLGGALLRAARAAWAWGGAVRHLLVCDRRSKPGLAFAEGRAARVDHEEFTLRLREAARWDAAKRLDIRPGSAADAGAMTALLAAAFGDGRAETAAFVQASFASPTRSAFVAALDGRIAAACFVGDEGGSLSVNTLGVDHALQGRGFGMEFLCAVLEATGREKPVLIDVDGGNSRALGLYRKAGFEIERSVAYFIAKEDAMIDGLNIRDARPGDEAALARLAEQLGYPTSAETVAARIVKYFGNAEERVIVAELDGVVIAWTSAALVDHFYTPRCVEISGLVVDAGLRGRGIGAALLGGVKRWAAELGVATVRLRANVIRAEAHRFYERQGFARVKQQIVFEAAADPSGAGGARGE
jgi:ribosomal protein S18 acetylase RimI-like enzyme